MPGMAGTKDPLEYRSIGMVGAVFLNEGYYYEELLRRLTDFVVRKAESNMCDFESASLIVSFLVDAPF